MTQVCQTKNKNVKFSEKNPDFFFLISFQDHEMAGIFTKLGLKQNHEIAGIMNCEITKCGDPLYLLNCRQWEA